MADEHANATADDAPILSPESTLRPGVSGVPIALGDGRVWLLAFDGLAPALDEARNRLFDAATINGSYNPQDCEWLYVAAFRLLRAAHALSAEEAAELVRGVEPGELVGPVETALFGDEAAARTYSTWARASLRANGIDPDRLPASEVRPTLAALEALGKALPRTLIASVEAAQRRANRRGLVKA